ncbi:hypothetical protein COX25_02755, partial [bacterium (Candidatus Howlettbacteria) CG23_combo_of_CG06-09_8_20_14_all_37_9]
YFDEISTICSRNYEISADKPVFSYTGGEILNYFDEISTICSRNYEISADKPVFSYTGGEILNRL